MKILTIISLILFIGTSIITAQNTVKYGVDKSLSYVTYAMSHPLHNWEGTSKNVLSVLLLNPENMQIVKVAVSIPVSTFDSENANRDSHMIEVVDGIKFPAVTFASTVIKTDGNNITVTGDIVFHGVTKSVTFDATTKTTGEKIEVNGAFIIKMSDFKIESPSLMGMPTKDEISLKFFAVYKPK